MFRIDDGSCVLCKEESNTMENISSTVSSQTTFGIIVKLHFQITFLYWRMSICKDEYDSYFSLTIPL